MMSGAPWKPRKIGLLALTIFGPSSPNRNKSNLPCRDMEQLQGHIDSFHDIIKDSFITRNQIDITKSCYLIAFRKLS